MGLFGRLFGSDPAKELEKARQALARDPARAMALARRAADGEHAAEANEIIEQARERLIANALDMAREAEHSEFFEDAAEWLDRALEQIRDEDQRTEVAARRQDMLAKAEAADEEPWQEVEEAEEEDADSPFEKGTLLDPFIDMMSDELAPQFRQQGEDFRRALIDMLEDRPSEALPVFDAVVAENPEDPVPRLERGRCRMILEDVPGARDDFDAAWEKLGDVPLFAGRAESVPGLWADAQLALGETGPVIERLEDLADPTRQRQDLAIPYATALMAEKRFEEAEAYLRQALRRMPKVNDLSYLYAGVAASLGDRDSAIAVLEGVIAPACAGGSCRPAALHVPSLRTLVDLHTSAGNTGRARELSAFLGLGENAVDTANLQPDRSATVI